MARFVVNEKTIDNVIPLAAKADICMSVKGVIVLVAQGSWLSAKACDNPKNNRNQEKWGLGESSAVFF